MVSRFVSTPLTRFVNPALLVAIYGAVCSIFSFVITNTSGKTMLASMFLIFCPSPSSRCR
jgi:FHS family L-fucose permease-like MFS transporter